MVLNNPEQKVKVIIAKFPHKMKMTSEMNKTKRDDND